MERPTFYLICDEAGAKGFSDKSEDHLTDSLGLAVGAIAFEDQLSELYKFCNKLYKKYAQGIDCKFHSTDLPADRQGKLREDIFEIVGQLNLHIVYESILRMGMNEWYKVRKQQLDDIQEQEKTRGYGINVDDPKENMLQELYVGIITRFFAAIIDHVKSDGIFTGSIYMDNIDQKTLRGIKSSINEIINWSDSSEEKITDCRYNYSTQKLEHAHGTIGMKFDIPESLAIDIFNNIQITIEINDKVTIIADVIANSLLHYAKNNLSKIPDLSMNGPELIEGYPLLPYFSSLSMEKTFDFKKQLYSISNTVK